MNTNPNRGNATRYESRRTQWRADLSVEIPLDRRGERNDYRSALIRLRRAERNRDEFVDTVRLEVRAAKRRLETAQSSIDIQREQIRINEVRKDLATAKLEAGELPSNRDVVDAEEALSQAKNDYAAAISDYRRAVLQFLRDTGTLRIGDDGRWIRYDSVSGEPLPSEADPAESAPAGP